MYRFLAKIAALVQRQGYVYVADRDESPFRDVTAPPWIVVDHALESIVIARWPGRLWRVAVRRRAPEQPEAYAGYTRAAAVRILEELPAATVFGAQGRSVAAVIDRAGTLTLEDVQVLGEAMHPSAPAAYSRVWQRWLGHDPGPHTLAVTGMKMRSPVGCGLTVLYAVLSERAGVVSGEEAFVVDEDGNRELAPPWDRAAEALLHAAVALGAPELAPEADREALTAAWSRI